MSAAVVVGAFVACGFVLACVYDPTPVGRPITWRSSGWVPVASSALVLVAVIILARWEML